MTPILYEATEIDFNHNGLGLLAEMYNVDVAEQRNGLFQLTAIYPTDGRLYKEMIVGNIILAKPNATDKLHAFRIVVSDLDVFTNTVQIEADSITYDLTHNLIKHVALKGDGQTAMSQLQAATMNPHLFTFASDILHTSESTLDMVNPMEAIAGTQGSFLQYWGGELKRENRKVSMLSRRGRDNVTTFRLGKNISGLKYNVDMSGLVTQILPYYPKTAASEEAVQNVYGKIVNSQYVGNYPTIYLQKVDVSQQITVLETDTDSEIETKINDYAKDWFTKSQNTDVDKPKVTVDVNVLSLQDSSDYQDKFKDLETVELTDTVTVYVPEFDINVTAIVNECHYDPMSERLVSLVIGAQKVSFTDANHNALNEMQDKIDEIHEDANTAVESANGKNTIFRGRDTPAHPIEGDMWYWQDGDKSGIRIFEKGNWEEVVDSKTQKRITDEVENAIEEANKYADELNDAQQQNLTESLDKVNNGLAEVQPKIDKAKEEAIANADGKIASIQTDVDNITEIVTNPETGLESTRVQLEDAIQQEVKDRKTGDTNTLTQAKDFTISQISSSETGMKSLLAQTSDSLVATISSMNWVVDSSLVNKIEHWAPISQKGTSGVGSPLYYSSAVRYKGVPSIGVSAEDNAANYSFMSAQDIARSSIPGSTIHISTDILVKTMGGTTSDYFIVYLHELDANKQPVKGGTSITGTIGGSGNVGANNKWTNYRETITLDAKTKFIRLTYQMRGNGNLYISRPYIGADKLPDGMYAAGPISTNATTLQLFKDNFALGIKDNTGELISGINGDASGVRLAGDKIILDGKVTVTEDFYAKGGNFENLNASHMTAGTLNAADVNVINFNADSITTGTIKGPNLSINLLNGTVTFQKGRLYSTTGTIDMNIDQGYLSVANNNTSTGNNVLIRNGEIAFTRPTIFDPSKNPYLRITNDVISSSFASSAIQARYGMELNTVGNESSVVDMGVQSLAGIKFGKGNSGKLERTLVGGGNQGVKISGGTITTGMLGASPSIVVGQNKTQDGAGNRVFINAEYLHAFSVYGQTTSSGGNVFVSSDGALVRSTSARKYKKNIKRDVPLVDSETLLQVPLSTWEDKAEIQRSSHSQRYFGMIAEDLADAGLDYLVTRDDEGTIEGIEYARVALLLIPLVKKLKEEVEELKNARKES